MSKTITVAEALLKRKHLAERVEVLRPLKNGADKGLFETRISRIKVSDDIDEAKLDIAKIKPEEITKEWDKACAELRKLDGLLQKANWTNVIDLSDLSSLDE